MKTRLLTIFILIIAVSLIIAQDKKEKATISITGQINVNYVAIDRTFYELEEAIDGGAAGTAKRRASDFFNGRITLNFGVNYKNLDALVQLETKSIDNDEFKRFAVDDTDELGLHLEQAYISTKDFLTKNLKLQVGIQDVVYKLRPQADPFFLDVTESESSFRGVTDAGATIRNVVYRDTLEPAGFKFSYDSGGFYMVDIFGYKVLENVPGGDEYRGANFDEDLWGLYISMAPWTERLSGFIVQTLNRGGETIVGPPVSRGKGQDVWTTGIGADFYVDSNKMIEAFGEVYYQYGSLRDDTNLTPRGEMSKKAYAFNVGARGMIDEARGIYAELAYTKVSGDDNLSDSDDHAFQSYENVDQFIILEGNDYGLDIDTNYRAIKAAVGISKIDLGQSGTLDADLLGGIFEFDQQLVSAAGSRYLTHSNLDLGEEVDLRLRWNYSENFTIKTTVGMLWNSDASDTITASRDDSGALLVFGVETRW